MKNTDSTGFTLIETLIVIGVFLLIIGFSTIISMDNVRGAIFRSECNRLITLLQIVRSNALNNINGTPHGIALFSDKYVEFEGTSYSVGTNRIEYPLQHALIIQPMNNPTEIIFSQLSGNASYDGTITMTDPKRSAIQCIISINSEGRISW